MQSCSSSVSRISCPLTYLKCLWNEEEAWRRVTKAGFTPPVCCLKQNWEKYLYEEIDTTASGGSVVSLCTARIHFCSRNLTKLFLIVYFSQNPSAQEWRGFLLPPGSEKICRLVTKLGVPVPTLSQLCPDVCGIDSQWKCGVAVVFHTRRTIRKGGTFWDVLVVMYLLSDH